MPYQGFAALMLCSAIVTLDGTAVTVALANIGADLRAPFSVLQWVTNASLVMLAALVVPAGALGDRYGCRRVMRIGLLLFACASAACAAAPSASWLVALRFAQGFGAALIVPGTLAIFRACYRSDLERTRAFGMAAGAAGVASAVGPVLGGALVDAWSWRAVFVMSAAVSAATLALIGSASETPTQPRKGFDLSSTFALIALLGSVSYALIEGGGGRWTAPPVLVAFATALGASLMLSRRSELSTIVPPAMMSRNCLAANGVTAALYFGLFGLSFLLVLYTQAVLGYSAMWAGLSVLPVSIAMLFCDRLGGLASSHGSRVLLALGPCLSAAGLFWVALGPDPLPFWSYIIPGAALFGTGLAIAVGPLTHAALSSLSAEDAGAASGVHHATVRAAGLVAIASLGTLAAGGNADTMTVEGFRKAVALSGAVVLMASIIAAVCIRDEEAGGVKAELPDLAG